MGRTGIILTTWVAMRHARPIDEAAALVIGHAARQGATRNPWEAGEDHVERLLRVTLPL